MRKNRAYTFIVCFLACNLLFNQVALNFFHNKHDAHKSYKLQSDQAQLNSHGEHCKICGLDTLFQLYFEPAPVFHFYHPGEIVIPIPVFAQVIISDDPINGRAPPFLI